MAVLLGVAVWTVLQFLGAGVAGSFELWGVGRAVGVLEILMIASLLLNARQLLAPSAMSLAVLAWIPWVFLNVAVTVRGDLLEWVLTGAMPVLLWPMVYLFFFAHAKASGRTAMPTERYFFVLGLLSVALFTNVFLQVNGDPVAGLQQLNAVYYPLMILPWMLISRKPLWRLVGTIAIVLAVVFSLKRTAIIAVSVVGVVYLMVGMMQRRSFRLRHLIIVMSVASVAWFVYLQAGNTIGSAVAERFVEARQDGGSGRVTIYADVLDALTDADAANLVFGHGHYSSLDRFGVTAHNDFLEVTFDYGLIGLALYLWLHTCLIRRARALYRSRSPHAAAFVASYVLFFVVSMTSHLVIYPTYFAYLVAFWGTTEGMSRCGQGQAAGVVTVPPRLRAGAVI